MALSNPMRSIKFLEIASDIRYPNHNLLKYINAQPIKLRILSFSQAWIYHHADAQLINYLDVEVVSLFETASVKTISDLLSKLRMLGITHIHKDNYFTYPVIYRTFFNEILANPRFSTLVVSGMGGNLFELTSPNQILNIAPKCFTSNKLDGVILNQTGYIKFILNNVLGKVGFSKTPPIGNSFSKDEALVISFKDLNSSLVPQNLQLGSGKSDYLTVSVDLRGSGIFRGSVIRFSNTNQTSTSQQLGVSITFAESRDEDGLVRLSGQVPYSLMTDQKIDSLKIESTGPGSPSGGDLIRLTICHYS